MVTNNEKLAFPFLVLGHPQVSLFKSPTELRKVRETSSRRANFLSSLNFLCVRMSIKMLIAPKIDKEISTQQAKA